MSDPILLFLIIDVVALATLGACVTRVPTTASGVLTAAVCGVGALVCLPALLFRLPDTVLALPVGPPGMALHMVLDPLAAVFLLTIFLAGTGIAAFQATTAPATDQPSLQVTIFCIAGTAFTFLAGDGVSLAFGLALSCATIRKGPIWLIAPLLVLIAVCLLTPAGDAPQFDTIRAAPPGLGRTTAAAVLTCAAVASLAWPRAGARCWCHDALTAGVVLPGAAYLLLRVITDLSAAASQGWWGSIVMLTGGVVTVRQGWRSAEAADIDAIVTALIRRQAGLALIGIGLTSIARAADLPGAAAFGLRAVLLICIGGGVAGTLASLATHAIGASAGTFRLSRLGGLVHLMPRTSVALSAAILALSALPPGVGFASLWLLFQAVLSAPRTGGLLVLVPLALIAAALAVSAALATAASVRLIGVAILGRPRSPRGSGAQESAAPASTILLAFAGFSVVAGVLPGLVLSGLADPAIRMLAGVPTSPFAVLSLSGASPGYLALPVLALVALATIAAILLARRPGPEGKFAGIWADGMPPPFGLPFGEPAAQSTGAGFLPVLPTIPVAGLLSLVPKPMRVSPAAWFRSLRADGTGTTKSRIAPIRPPSAIAGIWLVLTAFAGLLLVLAVTG